jgi:hypothetical protein
MFTVRIVQPIHTKRKVNNVKAAGAYSYHSDLKG